MPLSPSLITSISIVNNMENTTNDPSKSNNQIKDNSIENHETEPTSNYQNINNSTKMVAHDVATDDTTIRSPINSNVTKTKKKATLLDTSNIETICDDISSTTEDIKRLKHVQVRSNSTGRLYNSSRRVSFPENDSELVTGYLEPADPWACGKLYTILRFNVSHLFFINA